MKTKYIIGAVVMLALSISSCADLGFGVDVDSGPGTYWDSYGPYGGPWGSPYWNFGPAYDGPIYGHPYYPPFINTNPGPVILPSKPRPPQSRPPQINVNPGINRVPTSVGGIQRPYIAASTLI